MTVLSVLRSAGPGKWLTAVGAAIVVVPMWYAMSEWLDTRRKVKRHAEATLTEVFFANERSSRPDDPGVPMDKFTTEHVQRIVDYLDRARVSIYLGMYIVTVEKIGDALIRAKKRGVQVRVIGCASMSYSSGSQMIKLAEEDIIPRFNHKDAAYLMHHKFCLIDTEWLCPRCYHEERVKKSGFCCPSGQSAGAGAGGGQCNGNGGVPNGGDGAVMMATNGGIPSSPAGRSTKVVPCVLDGGRSCARCDGVKREAELRKRLQVEAGRDPLPAGGIIITGSTNWTMQALSGNYDNMIVTSIPDIVRPFQIEFQRMWADFAKTPEMITVGVGGAGEGGSRR